MSYPAMPQYGQACQPSYAQSPYDSCQQHQYPNQPLEHSISQQQYSSTQPQRPINPPHNSWSAPPPYSQQNLSAVYPPPPAPRPTPQPGYGAQLSATDSQNYYGSLPPVPSPAARPVSPLPASEAEYRNRLESAGVSEQQIAMILGTQTTAPQSPPSSNDEAQLIPPIQNLSINNPPKVDLKSKSYPFNLPKTEPIVLHVVDPPMDDGRTFGIVAPKSPYNSRIYTGEWVETSERPRPDLQLRYHKDRDTNYSRVAGSCSYSARSIKFKFPWLEWGDWYQASGTTSQHFDSDTGILNKKVMYFEKETLGHHGRPTLFIVRCKVTDQALDAEEKPKPEDRVILTHVVQAEPQPEIITIAPGVIENQEQLDELLTIALGSKQKFHLDMALWLRDNKKLDWDQLNDFSMVPQNVDGWGGENTTAVADRKAEKKARWKAGMKLFANGAKLANSIAIGVNGQSM